jgi:hypothetical protein
VPYLTAPAIMEEIEARGFVLDRPAPEQLAEPAPGPKYTTAYVCGGSIMGGLRRARYTLRKTAEKRAWLLTLKHRAT